MFKSPTQPLCRYCGDKIKKHTASVLFGRNSESMTSDHWTYRAETPRTREEAQRLVNQAIVSVKWDRPENVDGYKARQLGFAFIEQVGTWDGESYVDEFFCNGDHARRFAYVMARDGARTVAHQRAAAGREAGAGLAGPAPKVKPGAVKETKPARSSATKAQR